MTRKLNNGDRVYYQDWEDGPGRVHPGDQGTVVIRNGFTTVEWDTGEVDDVTETGWCPTHRFLARLSRRQKTTKKKALPSGEEDRAAQEQGTVITGTTHVLSE